MSAKVQTAASICRRRRDLKPERRMSAVLGLGDEMHLRASGRWRISFAW
ncbi:hypothetical protein [Mesorhizobium sp. M1D.F.Ca.ET.184.01.1.1]|nr:hypothetical protein [Mesorhizobium sp. M1D.F.Ca.ET.184.01.1.1]